MAPILLVSAGLWLLAITVSLLSDARRTAVRMEALVLRPLKDFPATVRRCSRVRGVKLRCPASLHHA